MRLTAMYCLGVWHSSRRYETLPAEKFYYILIVYKTDSITI